MLVVNRDDEKEGPTLLGQGLLRLIQEGGACEICVRYLVINTEVCYTIYEQIIEGVYNGA